MKETQTKHTIQYKKIYALFHLDQSARGKKINKQTKENKSVILIKVRLQHIVEHSYFASQVILGRAFHNRSAATKKALSPIQLRGTSATISVESFDDVVIGPVTGQRLFEMKSVKGLCSAGKWDAFINVNES